MKNIYKRIEKVAHKDIGSPEILALKAVEELGELAASLFHEIGYKQTNKSKEAIRENQLEEAVDVMVCMLGVLKKKGFTYDEIKTQFGKKIGKWETIAENRVLHKTIKK
jgi:NTP pyrophosphatase (non-canonical NTP hydrolase)